MNYQELQIVILAAGNSSRMGTSKQLLQVGNETLLEKTVRCASLSKIPNVTVVLGSNSELHSQKIKKTGVQIMINPDWALGLGNTLKFSLKSLLRSNINVQGVLFMVCDQPLITTEHINRMVDRYVNDEPVAIASQYKEAYGVPVLFDRIAFSTLLSIGDKSGGKSVLQRFEKELLLVPFKGGEIDLDTPAEYEQFLNQYKRQ